MRVILTKALCRGVYSAALAWGYSTTYVKTDPTIEAMAGIAQIGRQTGKTRALRKRAEQRQLEAQLSDPDVELEMEEA